MTRGHWWKLIAALVWLASASSVTAAQQRNEGQRTASRSNVDKAANTAATAIFNNVDVSQDAGCPDGNDARQSALCAQWEAADAARDAASYAFWSLIVGFVGTGFLVWTLAQTKQTAVREQRAYVRVDPAPGGVVQPGRRVCIPLNITNYGATPATEVATQSSIVVREVGWHWSKEATKDETHASDRPRITLHPQSPYLTTVEMTETLPRSAYDSVLAGKSVVFAKGKVMYRDVFRRRRETTFELEFHAEDKGDGTNGRIRLATSGNNFT
jgi:hypothetical protein